MELIVNGNICDSKDTAIVNAANGIGYMGGKKASRTKMRGVAESIQFATSGRAEKKANEFVTLFNPCKPGEVFYTDGCGLNSKYIIHAVTVPFPACRSKKMIVEKLLIKIKELCQDLNIDSISIPLLGAGTGGLDNDVVLEMIYYAFKKSNIKVNVYIPNITTLSVASMTTKSTTNEFWAWYKNKITNNDVQMKGA